MTIEKAIHRTFPTGLLHEPVLEDERIKTAQHHVAEIAKTLSQLTSLQICHRLRFGDDRYFAFAATLPPAPIFDDWVRCNKSAQIRYLAKHPPALPVWWAKFSFVFPVWHHYFNLWVLRPSDPRISTPPGQRNLRPLSGRTRLA